MERAVIFCTGKTLTAEYLPEMVQAKRTADEPAAGRNHHEPSLMDLERELIFRTLEKVGNNRQQAAQVLGISKNELDFKLQAYHWREG